MKHYFLRHRITFDKMFFFSFQLVYERVCYKQSELGRLVMLGSLQTLMFLL